MFPIFDAGQNSTRDKILSLLAKTPGMNTKKINALLKKQFSTSVSYQAVHKLLKQMVGERILKYNGKEYAISDEWIGELKRFLEQLETVSEGTSVRFNPDSERSSITLNGLKDYDEFYHDMREKILPELNSFPPDKRIIFYHVPHCYYALIYPTRELDFMNKLRKYNAKLYYLVRSDSPVDRWAKNFYTQTQDSPVQVFLNSNCDATREMLVFPSVVVETYFDADYSADFNRLYDQTKNIETIKLNNFLRNVYALKKPIHLVVNRNADIIETIVKLSKSLIGYANENKIDK